MLRIRLSMGGVRKRPIYKIVIADGRYPRDGKFIEKLVLTIHYFQKIKRKE